jgi:hypothetical protein
LPDRPSEEQLVLAYNEAVRAYAQQSADYAQLARENATLAVECREHMKTASKVFHLMESELVVLGAGVTKLNDRVTEVDAKIGITMASHVSAYHSPSMATAHKLASIPPMRPQADSSHDLAKAVGTAVAEQIEQEIHNVATPPPSAETMANIASNTVQEVIGQIKKASWHKLELEQRKFWLSVAITILASAWAAIEHFVVRHP